MVTTENKNRIITIVLLLLVALFAFLWIDSCSGRNKDQERYKQNIEAERDKTKFIKNELGTVTASKLSFQRTAQEMKEELTEAKKNGTKLQKELAILTSKFKSVTASGSAEAGVYIDTIKFKFIDTIPCIFKPKRPIVNNEFYNAALYIDNKSASIIDLNIPTDVHFAFGEVKHGGLFSKTESRIEATFTNPHIEITNIEGSVLYIEKKWYEKWWVWLLAGFGVGSTGVILSR